MEERVDRFGPKDHAVGRSDHGSIFFDQPLPDPRSQLRRPHTSSPELGRQLTRYPYPEVLDDLDVIEKYR